jgi:AraC-like DNA-binding protein
VDYLWSRHEEANRLSQTREQRLFADFIQLVNKDAVREHQIDYYASRLCLSARYMSTLIKKVSGHAAKDWIDDALVTHAKIALKHSNKSVAQISEELNFPNPSFFSKFFRRMTSMTPGEYRGRA